MGSETTVGQGAAQMCLPELAESVVEGEIVKWLLAEGDTVAAGDAVVEVMTDKVTLELPSPYSGVLVKQLVREGDVIAVGAPLANFALAGAALGEAPARETSPADDREKNDEGAGSSLFRADAAEAAASVVQIRRAAQQTQPQQTPTAPGAPDAALRGPYNRPVAVPAARRLARERGIDLRRLSGTGPQGRIRLEDVQNLQQAGVLEKLPYKAPVGREPQEARVPLRGLRRAISNQMTRAHLHPVRTLHVDEADVTDLVALRYRLKPLAAERGVKLSYMPFVMKAVLSALKAFPSLNSSLDEVTDEMVIKHYYNLGMAVAAEDGLLVPNIKDADQKSLVELADAVHVLAQKARSSGLKPEDMQGGTFTITNIGSLSGLFSFPIINVPEAAILGVHRIQKRPKVMPDDTIAARQMLYLSLSFDHRLIDGAEASQFTSHVIDRLETPEALMLDA